MSDLWSSFSSWFKEKANSRIQIPSVTQTLALPARCDNLPAGLLKPTPTEREFMQLRGIEFGHAFCSSGARNFTGKGYPYHKTLGWFGLAPNHSGSTLITKTVTLSRNPGNMPLLEDGLTPRDARPDCIIVKPLRGVALNAVGLSNFGADWFLNHPDFQESEDVGVTPTQIVVSFMPIGKTREERFQETR